jgi:hypothetical protein
MFLVCLATGVAYGQTPGEKQNVIGTIHDVQSPAVAGACMNCHTPHYANLNASILWARNLAATASFETYAGSIGVDRRTSTINAAVALDDPVYKSYLCMSCHDDAGAIAGDWFDAPVDNVTFFPVKNTPAITIGNRTTFTDDAGATNPVSQSHPVNVIYDPAAANASLHDVVTAEGNGVLFFPDATPEPTVQCATCHDPHETNYLKGTGPGAGPFGANRTYFIRGALTPAGETLCLACHQ